MPGKPILLQGRTTAMAFFEINDSFSLKSQKYTLRTTVVIEKSAILFLYSRDGKIIFSATRFYTAELPDPQKKQLALKIHEYYKKEIAKLFFFTKKVRQNVIQDAKVDILARGFLKYGMAHEAAALLTPLVEKYCDFSSARFTLGKALVETKNYKAARAHFVHLLKGQRKNADTCFYLGLCDYHLRNCATAVQAFTKAIAINRNFGGAYFYLGLTLLLNFILEQREDLAENLSERTNRLFLQAVNCIPALKLKEMQQGLMLIRRDFFRKAYECLAPLTKIVERRLQADIMNYEFHLAILWEPTKIDPAKAWREIQRLQRLIPRYPNESSLYYELSFAYTVLGLRVSAWSLQHLQKAVGLNPDYRAALKDVNLIQNDQKSYQAMLRALVKAH